MVRRYAAKPTPDASATDAALDALDAGELRTLIRDMIPWLDDATHARLVNVLVDRAARNSGWVPEGPGDAAVREIKAFATAAKRVGYAEPSEVDAYDWDNDEDRWLREVVQRTEGPEGLAKVARSSKRADDLRAWCAALVEVGDWKAALAAYDDTQAVQLRLPNGGM